MINKKCKIYQTDRRKDICNSIRDSYYINKEIEHIILNVRHPKINGVIIFVFKNLKQK